MTLTFPPREMRKHVHLKSLLVNEPKLNQLSVLEVAWLLLSRYDHDCSFFRGYNARFIQLLVSW